MGNSLQAKAFGDRVFRSGSVHWKPALRWLRAASLRCDGNAGWKPALQGARRPYADPRAAGFAEAAAGPYDAVIPFANL
jgi:hypothetical protein